MKCTALLIEHHKMLKNYVNIFFEPKLFLTILHMKGYNAFRELCGLKRVASIDYLVDLIPAKIVDRLKLIYDNVDDIDLFIGGISELPAPG